MNAEKDYTTEAEIQWCPGCPNFGILKAFKKAMAEMDKRPETLCLVSGIGQAAKLPHYLKCNFFNGLHGRAIPVAVGVHVANPDLTTLVVTGDGDCYGEGGNHFLHALRRNPNITMVIHNNEIYALTKGQASPTTQQGEKRALHTQGVALRPLNPLAIAILHDCTFVARGFAGDIDHLSTLFVQAVQHTGLSYVDVIQPCITWGEHPVSWYKERIYKLSEDYDAGDKAAALKTVMETAEQIPIGILYRSKPRRAFGADFRDRVTDRPLATVNPVNREAIQTILDEFKVENLS